ncbi:MAG: immunoglobulin-like domain-containing protein, partial [archaeon]
IAITTPANKLSYVVGDLLDITGLVVTGTYSDGSTSTEVITTGNISGFDSSVAVVGQVLTITVGTATTSYSVNITNAVVPSVNSVNIINSTIDGVYFASEATTSGAIVNITGTTTITDSTVSTSTIDNSNVSTSTVATSNLTSCLVIESTVIDYTGSNCDIEYSYVDPSSSASGTSRYSRIINSIFDYSNIIHSYLATSTVIYSDFNYSTSTNSIIATSTVDNSIIDNSNISLSDIDNANISNSTTTNNSVIASSTISNGSVIDASTITLSDIASSTVTNSTVANSTGTGSIITDSSVTSSTVTDSTVTNSTVTDSTISSSTLTNVVSASSSITNTILVNATTTDAVITNGFLVSGTITINGTTTTVTPPEVPVLISSIGTPASFTLTYTAGANGSLTGSSTQVVVSGTDGTAVTAVANVGFHFVDWSDASVANPRTDTAVAGDITVTANFAVDVVLPVSVTGVTVNPTTLNLLVGNTANLTATVLPINASNLNIVWNTSDALVATVSNGVVTANATGTADITVTTVDGSFTATTTVTVTSAVIVPTLSSIAITTPANKLVYTVGEVLDTTGLVVTGTYSDGSTSTQAFVVTGFNSGATTSSQVLTVTVGAFTANYTIVINAAVVTPPVTYPSVGGGAGTPIYSTYDPDTTEPTITLIGSNPVSLSVGETYAEAGATAYDNINGDITSRINIVSSVNTNVAGSYPVVYTVRDNAGNTGSITRTVVVNPVVLTNPVIIPVVTNPTGSTNGTPDSGIQIPSGVGELNPINVGEVSTTTSTSTATSTASNNSLFAAVAAGFSSIPNKPLISLILLAVVAMIVLIFYRRRKDKDTPNTPSTPDNLPTGNTPDMF